MDNINTTLNPIEAETLSTFGKLEKAKKLYAFNKNKSFLHAGFTALSLTVGASCTGLIFFSNMNSYTLFTVGVFSVAGAMGLGHEGIEAAKESKLHEAEAVTLTEKISMLRDKLKNSGNENNPPILHK